MPEGRITHPAIKESSGVVASRQYDDVLWTHNDANNPPELFAIDDDGELIQEYLISGIENIDWEDIALDANNTLYILDNSSLRRADRLSFIYMFPEPNPFEDLKVEQPRVIAFTYPDGPFDCEALLVWDDQIYLVTKSWDGSLPRIYRLKIPADPGRPVSARFEGEIGVHTMITGGDISPDGRSIILSSYVALLLFEGNGSPVELLQQEPKLARLNARQVEGVGWNGDEIIMTNEQGEIFDVQLSELEKHKAPFVRTPQESIPRLSQGEPTSLNFDEWEWGRRLETFWQGAEIDLARVGWTPGRLHIGIKIPEGVTLAEIPPDFPTDYDDWFRTGTVFILINPDGSRPIAYGKNDRCILVGSSDEALQVVAFNLKPATLVESTEKNPRWVAVQKVSNNLLVNLDLTALGKADSKEVGFNLIIIDASGGMVSWAPLTRRFTWDSPSVWGLLRMSG